MRAVLPLLVVLVLASRVQGFSIGDALGDVADTVTGAVSGAVDTVSDTAGNVVDGAANLGGNVVDTVVDAANSAWEGVKDAYEWVECTAVDFTVFDMDPCWEAPPSDLCTEDCKANLLQLPQACLDRLVTGIYNSGNETTIDRVESQIAACNITWTECTAVNWATFDMGPCENAAEDNLCPEDCQAQLQKLPQACLDRLVTQIGSQGNETISERLEAQIEACGMNFTLLSTNGSPRASAYGSLVVPLVVLLASMLLLGLLGP
ncbi:hypothetical protein CHLNCDRAFT_59404 [Chlorella variabilis]|uniref:FZ domain-containing protein n=1 Tax=Chlorella variabilis TaxID=554065 RepID=E1ZTJ5_CHLVA|nr:hypothetical protein CHLNCDRAFT_59404 [Chlorella variabilis]EFN50819.1 hypothetical protein CHLNCDRAFT_59404 [Chlorella variabilis]|eukprot:XP_005842921.1 hypothetical protein CHLNCDRAFT_59404 [Chlorella variabilis]